MDGAICPLLEFSEPLWHWALVVHHPQSLVPAGHMVVGADPTFAWRDHPAVAKGPPSWLPLGCCLRLQAGVGMEVAGSQGSPWACALVEACPGLGSITSQEPTLAHAVTLLLPL